ncbi:MAG: DUF4445 domain-containing protein [Lachnospiraceae bacterium]|nr:DUF4445 domain-containing protein [Lachnospiraceae bacterium]
MTQGQITIRYKDKSINEEIIESKLSFHKGESLLLLCEKAGIPLSAPCGGKGICGGCRVYFEKGAPLPKPQERKLLSAEELRQGVRLACMTQMSEDCVILIKEGKTDVISGKFDIAWAQDDQITDKGCDRLGQSCFFVADIGTTTVVLEKRKKSDGSVVDVYKAVNAQRKLGADVMTRMEASLSGRQAELKKLIGRQLSEGIACLNQKGEKADLLIIAANTTMVHLLLGLNVEKLAKAPFVPELLEETEWEIGSIKTYIMPGFSAFVGGDIASGIYALDYLEEKEPAFSSGTGWKLFLDLGTNAEMVLYRDKQGFATAAAAGPAFDGAAGTGFFGSDMVALLAKLYREGIVDETGTLDDAYFETGISIALQEGTLTFSQEQIRQLQLAKAAVRCGIDMLFKKAGIGEKDVDQVYLAGGFGYYLNPEDSAEIGLLPADLAKKAVACGNTALLGAAVYGRMILRGENRVLPAQLQSINLAQEPDFMESYVNYINLGSN